MRIAQKTILLFALTVQCLRADDKLSAPDFSGYPQTEAFQSFINAQTNVNLNLFRQTNILKIVYFFRNDAVGLLYIVNENGKELDVRDVYNFAMEASHQKQLSEDQLNDLRLAIKELPEKDILPPIRQLVVVSFNDGTNWVTRSYDRTNLPPAMHKIHSIIGERFETTDKNIFPPP
jgi:hypothetical protein